MKKSVKMMQENRLSRRILNLHVKCYTQYLIHYSYHKKDLGEGKISYELLPSIRYKSLTEEVYVMLKQAILEKKLKPGEKLDVSALARKFQVSRTPVTLALQRLAFEGLIEIFERKKTCVANLTPEMIEQTFDLRRVLETYAAERAVQLATSEQIESLRSLVTAMENTTDYARFLETDRMFHETFVDLAKNRRLSEMYRSLNVHSQVILVYYLRLDKRTGATANEHRRIVDFLEKRQLAELCESIRSHIETVKANLTVGCE